MAATVQSDMAWLANAIQYAGPQLTPKNVERGIFAVPGRGGAAWHDPASTQSGFGRTAGYPTRATCRWEWTTRRSGTTPTPSDRPTASPRIAKGVNWYLDGAKRYIAGTWPTKPFPFFQKKGAVVEVTPDPAIVGTPVPCTGCPSDGGPGSPSDA